MLNSKERAKLRSLASGLTATTIIGKEGLTKMVLMQIQKELEKKELVKISVSENAEKSAKEYLHEVANALAAEEVCSIGRKFVVYKFSNKAGVKHIEF